MIKKILVARGIAWARNEKKLGYQIKIEKMMIRVSSIDDNPIVLVLLYIHGQYSTTYCKTHDCQTTE